MLGKRREHGWEVAGRYNVVLVEKNQSATVGDRRANVARIRLAPPLGRIHDSEFQSVVELVRNRDRTIFRAVVADENLEAAVNDLFCES
jgi:hypothetical protein